jgi:hypothetical protein
LCKVRKEKEQWYGEKEKKKQNFQESIRQIPDRKFPVSPMKINQVLVWFRTFVRKLK